MRIVGVARDIRSEGPASDSRPEIFMPYEQHPRPSTAVTLVVRTAARSVRAARSHPEPDQQRQPGCPGARDDVCGHARDRDGGPRFRTYLLTVFAAVALLLALAGIYGVMAYSVSQRVPELGVRIALGATPGSVRRLVLRQGAAVALTGPALGFALAFYAGRLLEGLLFGITARDPLTLAGVALSVTAASLAACYVPGRRAARVDPMTALRGE